MFGKIDLINDLAKKFGEFVYNSIVMLHACDVWMVLVWQNCVHSPNLPSFLSHQTFPLYGIYRYINKNSFMIPDVVANWF